MKVKIVLKQLNMEISGHMTFIRDCRDFEWESDSLSLLDSKGHYSMIIPIQNILCMEVLEGADSKG